MARTYYIHRIIVAAALILSACTSGKAPRTVSQPPSPMILFAVDGLDWQVMAPLLADGRLPVMAGLMSRGTFGYLESMTPTYSAVIWTSIATRQNAG